MISQSPDPLHTSSGFLPYGSGTLKLSHLPGNSMLCLPNSRSPASGEVEIVASAAQFPMGAPPLEQLAKGRKSAVILISCRTRTTGSATYVPSLLDSLNRAGLADHQVRVITATGTHNNWRSEDASLLLGSAAGRVEFTGHDCETAAKLVHVGTTSFGNEVHLSRSYLDADLKIATGRVMLHYFAGFSAGRKAVLPGVAGRQTILYNHAMAVRRVGDDVEIHPGCRNGNLAGNPVHMDMLEAARMAPPDFTLNTIVNWRGEITDVFAGEMEAAHTAAVQIVRNEDRPTIAQKCDWMFLSCGGAPADCNAIQAIKAILNNYEAVRAGGVIIFAAECAEGTPQWLTEACAVPEVTTLKQNICAGRVRQAHNPLWVHAAREHAHILMITKLPEADVNALGFRKMATVEDAVAEARRLAGEPAFTAVVPYGNQTAVQVFEA